jgi:hypothetical protein
MEQLAIFVEGQTEAIFMEKFLFAIIDRKQIKIETQRKQGKGYFQTTLAAEEENKKYFVMIADCCNDEAVKSEMLNFFDTGRASPYKRVLGLRDVYPIPISEITRLKDRLKEDLPHNFKIFLAIQEIEAWFIAENSHFLKVHPKLTPEFIYKETGIEIAPNIVESIYHPAEELNKIFNTANKEYKKKKSFLNQYVYKLDYDELYLNLPSQVPSLGDFVTELDSFFT